MGFLLSSGPNSCPSSAMFSLSWQLSGVAPGLQCGITWLLWSGVSELPRGTWRPEKTVLQWSRSLGAGGPLLRTVPKMKKCIPHRSVLWDSNLIKSLSLILWAHNTKSEVLFVQEVKFIFGSTYKHSVNQGETVFYLAWRIFCCWAMLIHTYGCHVRGVSLGYEHMSTPLGLGMWPRVHWGLCHSPGSYCPFGSLKQ